MTANAMETRNKTCRVCGGAVTEQHVKNDVWYKCMRKQLYGELACKPNLGPIALAPSRVCWGYRITGDLLCTLQAGHEGDHYDENALEGENTWAL